MKKVILSIAFVAAGLFTLSTIQAANTTNGQPGIEVTSNDDGFVDVKFDALNKKVQAAVRVVAQEYELNALKYNAEKQLTKVEATKKEDQSKKTFYFDAEGKELVMEEAKKAEATEKTGTMKQEETPSAENFYSEVKGDDGFVAVKIEELNEKVQASINALKETCEVDSIMYNAEKQITKVEVTIKEDQSKKTVYLDNEGVETTWEKPAGDVVKEKETEGVL